MEITLRILLLEVSKGIKLNEKTEKRNRKGKPNMQMVWLKPKFKVQSARKLKKRQNQFIAIILLQNQQKDKCNSRQ